MLPFVSSLFLGVLCLSPFEDITDYPGCAFTRDPHPLYQAFLQARTDTDFEAQARIAKEIGESENLPVEVRTYFLERYAKRVSDQEGIEVYKQIQDLWRDSPEAQLYCDIEIWNRYANGRNNFDEVRAYGEKILKQYSPYLCELVDLRMELAREAWLDAKGDPLHDIPCAELAIAYTEDAWQSVKDIKANPSLCDDPKLLERLVGFEQNAEHNTERYAKRLANARDSADRRARWALAKSVNSIVAEVENDHSALEAGRTDPPVPRDMNPAPILPSAEQTVPKAKRTISLPYLCLAVAIGGVNVAAIVIATWRMGIRSNRRS